MRWHGHEITEIKLKQTENGMKWHGTENVGLSCTLQIRSAHGSQQGGLGTFPYSALSEFGARAIDPPSHWLLAANPPAPEIKMKKKKNINMKHKENGNERRCNDMAITVKLN